MNRFTVVLLVAAALSVAGCGGGGGGSAGAGGGSTGGQAVGIVSLATTMINEATSEECPTDDHCNPWPVESLADVTLDDEADPVDL